MRLITVAAAAAVHLALLSPPPLLARVDQATARPDLAGTWTLNPALGTPRGSAAMPDDDTGMGPGRPVGGGGGGGGGGIGGGGIGGRTPFGNRGGASRGGPPPRKGDRAASGALMQELLEPVARVTIRQDGDRIAFVEADGIAREYVANDKVEKHQLVNGTIETKTRWDGDALVMELRASKRMTIVRRYTVRGDERRLEVTTSVDGGPKSAKRLAVYEVAEPAVTSGPQ
jgi:hypothetical protein